MKLLMNDEAQFMKLLRFAVGSTSRAEETRGKRGKAAERGQMENVRSGPGPSRRFHQYNCPIVWLDRETEAQEANTHTDVEPCCCHGCRQTPSTRGRETKTEGRKVRRLLWDEDSFNVCLLDIS